MSDTPIRRWTRSEYHRARNSGLFLPDERLELLDGLIVEKDRRMSPRYGFCIRQIAQWLEGEVKRRFDVRQLLPIALDDRSEPQPDISVVKGQPKDYLADHPSPEAIVLLVEVFDGELPRGRSVKPALYHQAGIAEFWLVDLEARQLEMYREPSPTGYGIVTILAEGNSIAPLFLPGSEMLVADLLPPIG